MRQNSNASASTAVCAGLAAASVFFVDPIYETLIPAHFMMMAIIGAWLCLKSPHAAFIALGATVLSAAYLLVVNELVTLGDRVFSESVKYSLIILFACSIIAFNDFGRRALLYLSFAIPAVLVMYIIFSQDPFVYGGRLGVVVSGLGTEGMVSANTIGLAVNISMATLLANRRKLFYLFAPVYVMLIYFTLSRGALLSIIVVWIFFFVRMKKLSYVIVLSLPAIYLSLDMSTNIFEAFRLDDATGSGRSILYQIMLDDMLAKPVTFLFGNGPGSVDVEIYAGKTLISAHSGYLEMLYTFGLLGMAAVVFFVMKTIRNFWSLPLDSLLYCVLLASYAISEDLLGAHNLAVLGLMFGVILHDFKMVERRRAIGTVEVRGRPIRPEDIALVGRSSILQSHVHPLGMVTRGGNVSSRSRL